MHYETAGGTATANQDYRPVSGTLTFDPADPVTSQSVTIPILTDTALDDGETVQVKLSAAVNGVIQRATATITIRNTTPRLRLTWWCGRGRCMAGRWTSRPIRSGLAS